MICSHIATSSKLGDAEVAAADVDGLESTGSEVISHPVMPMTAIAASVKVWIRCFMLIFVLKNGVECSEGLLSLFKSDYSNSSLGAPYFAGHSHRWNGSLAPASPVRKVQVPFTCFHSSRVSGLS